jgi:pilus assembly protein CpaF
LSRINLQEKIYNEEQRKISTTVTYGETNQGVVANDDIKVVVEKIKVYLSDYHSNIFSKSVLNIEVKEAVKNIIRNYIVDNHVSTETMTLDEIIDYCQTEICGFGPIDPPLMDPTVSEIMVNCSDEVYVERNGRLELTDIKFDSEEQLINIIRKILAPIGRSIDLADPYVDAKLPGGSRVNAVIYPIALQGTNLTIRKFVKIDFQAKELLDYGTCSKEMLDFLELIVRYKGNFLVTGGTSSGKTSTLKFLCNYIPANERLDTIEDVEELRLKISNSSDRHVISHEARKSKENPVTIYDLLKNALRQRPDRIIVGEVRGIEALEMIEAMNTGHEGSCSTLHANSAEDAVTRLAMMLQRAGLEYEISKEVICSTIDYVVHQRRMIDGSRKIVEIIQIDGYNHETRQPILVPVFKYIVTDIDKDKIFGCFQKVGGLTAKKIEKLRLAGAPQELLNNFIKCEG